MKMTTDVRGLRSSLWRWAMSALVLWAAVACKQETVTHARVAKTALPPAPGPGAMGGPMGGGMAGGAAGQLPPPPRPAAGASLKWTLPAGWTQDAGSGMRYATIKAPTPGKLDISVVVLPGAAGGELANVNRWRGQLGLAPVEESALAALRAPLQSKAGAMSVYDLVSDGEQKSRMVAGLLMAADGSTWFLKMVGDDSAVGANKAEFVHLLETAHFE